MTSHKGRGGDAGAKLLEDGLLDSGMAQPTPPQPTRARWLAIGAVLAIGSLYAYEWVTLWGSDWSSTVEVWWLNILTPVATLITIIVAIPGLYRYRPSGWYAALGLITFQAAFPFALLLANFLSGEPLSVTRLLSSPTLWVIGLTLLTGWLPLVGCLRKSVRQSFGVSPRSASLTVIIGIALRLVVTTLFYV